MPAAGSSRGGSERKPSSGRPSSGGRPGAPSRSSSGKPAGGGRPSSGRPSSGKPAGSGRPPAGKPSSSRGASGGSSRSDSRDSRDDRRTTSRSSDARSPRSTSRPDSRDSRAGSGRSDSRDSRSGSGRSDSRDSRSGSGRPDSRAPRSTDRRDDRRDDRRSDDRRPSTGQRSGGPSRSTSSDRRGAPGGRSSSSAPRRTNDRYDRDERPQRTERVREPHIPDEIKAEQLDKSIALELRTLPDGLAEIVARHLVAADLAMQNEDFALAAEHVGAAKRRAGRSSVVREAAGIVAYQSGNFAEALTDLRAVRRMTGSNALLPLIADCERGLGKPQKALDTIKAVANSKLSPELRSELLIVSAGARADMGKLDAAIVTLQVPELTKLQPGTPRARLQYAYADLLLTAGRINEAWEWMERAAGSDIDGETDAAERCEEFAGISFTEEELDSDR
jgi:hypothetical protein